jgi:radical SAM superfamily enzyme YgiQ (UPF0313 family)
MFTANTFVPDNSLATLAAVLARHEIPVEIVDLQNPLDMGAIAGGIDPECAHAVLSALTGGKAVEHAAFENYRRERDRARERFELDQTELLLAKVERERVGLVGFKLWAGSGFAGSVRMAEALRRRFPDITLVAGGPAVRYAGETLTERTRVFDYLVHGDGEGPLLELARGLRGNVPGSIRSGLGRVDSACPAVQTSLNAIPAPRYDAQIYPKVTDFFRIRVIDESRGCFNSCSFCSHRFISGPTRRKDPKLVVDEIEHAYRADGVTYFRFAGSNPPSKHLTAIAEEILRRRLPVFYSAYASMNNLKPATLPLLAASGLRGLLFGLESGDPDFLFRVHNKRNGSPDQIVHTLQAAMQQGIFVAISLIVPSPFETVATKRATFDLVARIFERSRHGSVIVFPALLAPGSGWWDRMHDYGFEFLPGFDRTRLTLSLLEWDPFFMLPRDLAKTLGYSLNGKPSDALFAECQLFIDDIDKTGIPSNVDDAAYMLARMGGLGVDQFKREMCTRLVAGDTHTLSNFVSRINAAAERVAA